MIIKYTKEEKEAILKSVNDWIATDTTVVMEPNQKLVKGQVDKITRMFISAESDNRHSFLMNVYGIVDLMNGFAEWVLSWSKSGKASKKYFTSFNQLKVQLRTYIELKKTSALNRLKDKKEEDIEQEVKEEIAIDNMADKGTE